MTNIFIKPIYYLIQESEKIRICDTLFIKKENVINILINKFDIDGLSRISKWISSYEEANVFAIQYSNRKKEDVVTEIENALSILSFSNLGYDKRSLCRRNPIMDKSDIIYNKLIVLSPDTKNGSKQEFLKGTIDSLYLDSRWKKFHQNNFWLKLIEIINKETSINDTWRNQLKKASIIAGKSQQVYDRIYAFLLNMITLEILLTQRNEKESIEIPKRINTLIGWHEQWSNDNYISKIQEIYDKRCKFVHEGDLNSITVNDLLFSDEIVFNVFNNLVNNIDIIQGIDDLKKLTEKVEAAELLKEKIGEINIRPPFVFVTREYSAKDKIGL